VLDHPMLPLDPPIPDFHPALQMLVRTLPITTAADWAERLVDRGVTARPTPNPHPTHPGQWPLMVLIGDVLPNWSTLEEDARQATWKLWQLFQRAGDDPDRAHWAGVSPRERVAQTPVGAYFKAQERLATLTQTAPAPAGRRRFRS